MYKIVNGIEKIDKEDLVLVTEEAKSTRGCVKMISFPHRMVEKRLLQRWCWN
ncbi:hypothetical protein E2C01_081934 [Portunus trituberculatus]|uniref:Uncharacterized protein n=1 Tax=Portunus trituberculatus TaxID=210409 RepID=A0A5B7J3M7_PORTR|nr:hypothetical protein [Portunus trituberculatus]